MATPPGTVDGAVVRRWAEAGRDALAQAREEIDGLNVYPVPDGDTGTNLELTFAVAARALAAVADDASPATVLGALAHGAMLGARGNSGVILSQMLRGLAETAAGCNGHLDPQAWADGLGRAAAAGYAAVGDPVEGTMLTVLRDAAEAARRRSLCGGTLDDVVRATAAEAAAALGRTPHQLAILSESGVVDAGGRGVCVLLDALVAVVTGAPVTDRRLAPGNEPMPQSRAAASAAAGGRRSPGYEVMYLLDAPAEAVPALRSSLGQLGDSLVVVGAEPAWNVHVHVDDVGAAIEAGIAAGRPHGVRVTDLRDPHLRDPHLRVPAAADVPGRPAEGRGVVSVVAGRGLRDLFEAAGATAVAGGPDRRASSGEILAGIRAAGRREVVVLPNDPGSLAVAQAVASPARAEGYRVAVVPTRATVQALAAVAVHDPACRFEDDVVAMTAAAGHCRHGGVTVATRDAVTMAGVCREGDVLGVIDGDFSVIGSEAAGVARTVVERMLGSGGELVTVVVGADGDEALSAAVVAHVRAVHPEVDTRVYGGGQPRYPLLLGVE